LGVQDSRGLELCMKLSIFITLNLHQYLNPSLHFTCPDLTSLKAMSTGIVLEAQFVVM